MLKLLAPKMTCIKPYMRGTASIDYIYKRERDALRETALCTCSSGSATERTITCPLHRAGSKAPSPKKKSDEAMPGDKEDLKAYP
jgi:hypothetical protein